MPLRTLSVDKRIGVAEALPVERHSPEQCVVHCLLVQVGILRIVIGEVQPVLEEHEPAARACFAVGLIAQRVIWSEAL